MKRNMVLAIEMRNSCPLYWEGEKDCTFVVSAESIKGLKVLQKLIGIKLLSLKKAERRIQQNVVKVFIII